MAQIPVQNFGQVVAQPAQAIQSQAVNVSGPAGAAVDSVASAYHEQEQQRIAAKTSLALATSTNALHDAHDQVTQGVLDGSIAPQDANQEMAKRSAAIQQTQSEGLPPQQQQALSTSLIPTVGALNRSIDGTVFRYGQSQQAATIDATGEQLQRDALRRGAGPASETYDAIVDMTGGAAGFTPEQAAAKKQAFREHVTASVYDTKATNLLSDGNLGGLTDLLHEVQGPAGDAMDPTKRAEITHQVLGYQNHLLAQQQRDSDAAERERVARENTALDSFKQASDVVLNGAFLSKDAIDDISAKSAGTSVAPMVTQLLASQTKVAGFASAPAGQRTQIIEQYRANGANPAVGTSPDAQKQIAQLAAVDAKVTAAVKDNPWAAAQQFGVITDATVMDPTDPVAAQAIVRQRMQQIGQVENWVGRKISPLQPEEATRLAKSINSLPPDQAASSLSGLGSMIGDADRIDAFARQLDDKDGTLGLAMAYAGDGQKSSGRLVASLLLQGNQALKDKTSTEDTAKQSGWRATAATSIRGAFSDRTIEDKAIDAAVKINAAMALTGNDDMEKAISLATGGIIEHGNGKIPMPYGIQTKDEFDSKLKQQVTMQSLAPQSPDSFVFAGKSMIPLDSFVQSLPDATLVHAGQGLYNVRAGSQLVTNKDGKRITIQVHP